MYVRNEKGENTSLDDTKLVSIQKVKRSLNESES